MHTPGPIKWAEERTLLHLVNEDGDGTLVSTVSTRHQSIRNLQDEHKRRHTDTTDLLAHAYTSYDKHFGPNAVEAAKSDALGVLLEIAEVYMMYLTRQMRPSETTEQWVVDTAKSLLSRTKENA